MQETFYVFLPIYFVVSRATPLEFLLLMCYNTLRKIIL